MGVLEVLGNGGDIKIEWDADDEQSIEQARAEFDVIKGKGLRIMRIQDDGSTEAVDTFDPTEGRYVAIPQLVGG